MFPLDTLLTEYIHLTPGQRCLVFAYEMGTAAWSLAAASPQANIDIIDPHFLSRRRLLESQASYPNISVSGTIEPFPDAPACDRQYDCVILIVPKGRLLARRWLAHAMTALAPGGRLILAGAKELGIESIGRDAETLTGAKGLVLGYKKGQRLIGFTPRAWPATTPDWLYQAGIAPGTWTPLTIETPAGCLHLETLPGVFAFDALDEGTRMLLANLSIHAADEVLDVGCGNGVIGIVAALLGASRVEMVDINLLAVSAARHNLTRLELSQAKAYPGNALRETSEQGFSLIASNPPFHSGKDVDYRAAEEFIRQGRQALKPGGRMTLVANRFIRYDRLMTGLFARVETLEANGRFNVLCGWV